MQPVQVNRGRRAIISVGIIAFCLLFNAYLALTMKDSTLASHVADGFFSIAELVAMFYLGGSVIDSTNIAGVLAGKRFGSSQEPSYGSYSDGYSGNYEVTNGAPEASYKEPEVVEDIFPEAPKAISRRKVKR